MDTKSWSLPPKIKIYEALGALADKRINVEGNSAKVYSSSGNKFYTVTYDPETAAIMCNDNGSYWTGYLGYPAISYLLAINIIPYNLKISELLKDIKWKDINQDFKNDFDKTEEYVKELVVSRNGNLKELMAEINRVYIYLESHQFPLLGTKTKPATGY